MSVNRFFYYEDDIYKDYRKQPDLSGCFLMGAGAGRFELIEFLQRGCGLRRISMLASDGVTTNLTN